MKQYKKSGTCTIDSRDYIYLAYFTFKIISLKTDKVIYEEERPFPKYNRKMQITNVIVNKNFIIIINIKSDFVLYEYIPKLKQIKKICTYYQRKGNIERYDVYEHWKAKSGFAFLMDDLKRPNESLIRYISKTCSIKDYYFPKKLFGFAPEMDNQIAVRDLDNNMYVFNENFTSEEDIIIKKDDLTNIFKNNTFGQFHFLIKFKNVEYGIFQKDDNTISIRKHTNDKWELVEEKPIKLNLADYYAFFKNNKIGLVEYYPNFLDNEFECRFDFNNIRKKLYTTNDFHIFHLIVANDKYICFFSALSRLSILVFKISELDDE